MNITGKIVVGVDGSESSLQALRWALAEAELRKAAVDVIHCWHVNYYGDMSGTIAYPEEVFASAARDVLDAALKAVSDEAKTVTVTGHLQLGSAAAAMILAGEAADLLVVGRRGHGGFLSLVMGSVATQVSSHATCPVVIVAPPAEPQGLESATTG
jgi:nucleotide-binding universal stress UspA family protein